MATKEINLIVLVSHQFVHNSFLNGTKASREFSSLANKCATVLIHERSAGASDQTFPQKRVGPCRRASVACCRSRPTVSPHKERRGAASQQHYRFLSVFVCLPSARQHDTRETAKLPGGDSREIFQVASDGRNVNSFTAVYITANLTSNRRDSSSLLSKALY